MFEERNTENRKKQRIDRQNELRQARRDEAINKRRDIKQTTGLSNSTYSELRGKLMSTDLNAVYRAAYEFRSILSCVDNPPIQSVIDEGIVPRLVELLSPNCDCYISGSPEIIINTRLESAWAITNIASGTTEQTAFVTDSGAIPLLVDMINDDNPEVIDQGIWALGNIAGDNEISRDVIIDSDVLPRLINLMNRIIHDPRYIKLLRNATWLLSNLNRGRNPPPSLSNMEYSLSMLHKLLELKDPDTLNDTFWALSYICDADSRSAEMVLQTDILDRAMVFLQSSLNNDILGTYLVCSIIRMIGNIVTGTDQQAEIIIKKGFLDIFREIYLNYRDEKKINKIRKEICWTLSNVAAGTEKQVMAIFEKNLIEILIDALNGEINVKIEAAWAISNIMSVSDKNENQLSLILSSNMIPALIKTIEDFQGYTDLLKQILTVSRKVLDAGYRFSKPKGIDNPVLIAFNSTNFSQILQEFSSSGNVSLKNKAQVLLSVYFS